ncbi:MAG: cardiolipin synthase [Gammaproteobacteria bacterium]|nr:cardiolipin synthase [Gammaproteobacteria bacterium]
MDLPGYLVIFGAVALALTYVLAIPSALEAILKARTAQGSIAWVISLLAMPPIAVPAYLVFGRSRFDGYLEERDTVEAQATRLIDQTSDFIEKHLVKTDSDTPLYTSLFRLARMPATSGNHVTLLIDGTQTFTSIALGLRRARQFILFQFYIVRDDDLGNRLGKILIDKAREGVDVFFLYDEIGSSGFHNTALHKALCTAGVKVTSFNTTQGRRNRFQLNFRNHRKVVVVDGKEAWVGGHNVGNEYLGFESPMAPWRDTHVSIRGPAVLGAMLAFATDWHWATRTNLNLQIHSMPTSDGASNVLVFPSDPASEYEEAGLMYHQVIFAARKRIWIASPYFVPDNAIMSALQLAALRGVDVRVIIPERTDAVLVGLANWSFVSQLLPFGIKIYRYLPGFMHQKVFLLDDEIAGVGTANFDNRSFRLNFEITLLIEDRAFASEVESMLEQDMAQCRQVSDQEIKNKSIWFTLATSAARLLAPVL